MNKLIYFFLLLIILPSALSIETHEIYYDIKDNLVKVQHKIITNNSIQLIVPEDAYNFDITANKKITNFTLLRTEQYKQILISPPANYNKIEISYLTSLFIEKGKYSYFTGIIKTTQITETLSIYLTLPEKALLARPLNALNPPVNPKPSTVKTTGRQIIIEWTEKNIKPDQAFPIFVVYEENKKTLWHIIIRGLIILSLVILFYFYIKHKNTIKIKKINFSHLLEKEQTIVNALLKSKKQTMWQKELQIAAGFTKSKLSRTIRNMEQRNLIKKIPYGTTNKIELITNKENKENKTDKTEK